MVNRSDAGSVGVIAGRVVGVLTTVLTVGVMLTHQASFYRIVRMLVAGLESDVAIPVWVLFWANVGLVALARYGFCYVAGSLFGVVYEWLDRPGLWLVTITVGVIGLLDGLYGGFSAGSVGVGLAYLLSWLTFLVVFAWLLEDTATTENGPTRLD